MSSLSVTDLAENWFRDGQKVSSADPSRNMLFEMLYNACQRRLGISKAYSELSYENGDHYEACAQLFSWYTNRYGTQLNMYKGSKGQKRTVGLTDEDYTFDRLYCDDRQFRNYLETELPHSGSQDLLAFVLHTAVAFMVPLEELDAVLQYLGFHPLHVKKIHHLSIAYVLLRGHPDGADADFNPFAEVKKLYFKAREILNTSDIPAKEAYSYADLETRMIRDMLLRNKGLVSQNFENLVARNRKALNMRHSMILEDFHRLSAVFIHIFDSDADTETFDYPDEAYSFYCFVKKFCKEEKLLRKKYREQLTGMINLKQKHPTRNVLILLWLYAYCFAFLPGIYIDKRIFIRITKQLQKTDPKWATEAKTYYHDEYFDVFGFLTNQPKRSVSQTFRGSDFITFINEKLLLRYGWGPLNDKIPFDYYIHKLEKMMLRIAPSGRCSGASYDSCPLEGLVEAVDNVPFPLVAVTQLFDILRQLHTEKAARSKRIKISPCPLKCGLYEQL